MADNSQRTPGTGEAIATDEVTDGTLGSCKVQFVKLMDGTLDGTTKAAVGANGLSVDVKNSSIAVAAGSVASSLLGVQGPTARDAAIAALPVTIGGRAATTPQADVDADGDVVNARFDRHGCLFVSQHEWANQNTITPNVNGGVAVGGCTAADSPSAAFPLMAGGKVYGVTLTQPAAMSADADVANLSCDPYGRLMVAEINPLLYKTKAYNDTSARAAASAVSALAPTGSRRLIITGYEISAYGTTAARVMFYFGSSASSDTTYTAGTDPPVFIGSFAPSATANPGAIMTGLHIVAPAVDYNIMYQNSAAISIDVVWHFYEVS